MDKKVIRLSEAELRNMIEAAINESVAKGELDEAFWGSLKGFGNTMKNTAQSAGQAMQNAAQNVGSKVANAAKTAGTKVANAAKSAGQAVNKQVNDFKQGMAAGSDEEDFKKAFSMLQTWAKKGYFGGSRQAASQIAGLKNAMIRNFKEKYGKDLAI